MKKWTELTKEQREIIIGVGVASYQKSREELGSLDNKVKIAGMVERLYHTMVAGVRACK